MELPARTRVYQHHHLDSKRWDGFRPRDGDVIISTSMKAGTTWMQRIMSLLVFGPGKLEATLQGISPWIDARFWGPIEEILADVEAQRRQRFLKSHLPLDALPYFPQVRYIFVCRDTRDMFMSLWNHYAGYHEGFYALLDEGDPPGGPMPRCRGDIREAWRDFMTRGSFPWESDGWPFWSHHYHASSFWPYRRLPNVLLVHYADMLAELEAEMRRVAAFTGIDVPDAQWPALVEAARFANMKADAEQLLGTMERTFSNGVETFINKGTNGRWRDALTSEDLALYEGVAGRLDPRLRAWMEQGRLGAGDPATV